MGEILGIRVLEIDWDGPLCNSGPDYTDYFNMVLKRRGLPTITLKDFRERLSAPDAKTILAHCGVQDTEAAMREFLEITRQSPPPPLFPDTFDTLRWLRDRGIAVYLVSAHPFPDVIRMVNHYELTPFLTACVGSASPDEKVNTLKGLAKKFSLNEIVFVDDMDVILKRVRELNLCHVVGVTTGYCSPERVLKANPHRVIHDLKGLQRFINSVYAPHTT